MTSSSGHDIGGDDDAGFHARPRTSTIPGTGGHYKATCDEEQIWKWWKRRPNALIGMPMGARTGIWALDVDTSEDHDDGLKAWPKIAAKHPAIVTREHRSATDGSHLIFIWEAENPIACSSGALPAGIHVKGMGGYIVVPPSKRKGRAYSVFKDIDPVEPPRWLVDLIRGDRQQSRAPNEVLTADDPAKVAYAVRVTPNELRGWPEWKRYVMAIWSALDGDADAMHEIVTNSVNVGRSAITMRPSLIGVCLKSAAVRPIASAPARSMAWPTKRILVGATNTTLSSRSA